MPIENEELRRFGEAAAQLAEASKLTGIRLGFVYVEQVALGVRAELVRERASGEEWGHYDPIHAYRCVHPIQELEPLLSAFSQGFVHPQMGVKFVQTFPWRFSADQWESDVYSVYTMARADGQRLDEIIKTHEELKRFNRIIATKSGYAYASLARLVRAFTKNPFEEYALNSPARGFLVAPWPISYIETMREGPRLRIEVAGLSDFDRSRIIINIESPGGDWRADKSQLRWSPAPSPIAGRSFYTTFLDDAGPVTAVNAFFEGADVVALRSEVKAQPRPDDLVNTNIRRLAGKTTVFPLPETRIETTRTPNTFLPESMKVVGLTAVGFRSLRSVEFKLDPPLAVVVGPNQSGKSTLLDAFGLLAEAAQQNGLYEAIIRRRGGFHFLRWKGTGSENVALVAGLESASGRKFRYGFELAPVGTYDYAVSLEYLLELRNEQRVPLLEASQGKVRLDGREFNSSTPHELLISQIRHPLLEEVRSALGSIAVYPYFQTGAAWADPEAVKIRAPARPEPGARLDRLGGNLAAVLYSMREERPDDWSHYLQIVRLAFPALKDLRLPAPARGQVQLLWDTLEGQTFEAAELSDGTLHFLATLCAFFQPGNSLVAVDEPEQHLHPDALMRLIGAAQIMADRHPILLTTQSDALISMMNETPENIVVARRGPEGTELIRPPPDDLRAWLRKFSLAEMRHELESWSAEE